jgi:hypothetical protein
MKRINSNFAEALMMLAHCRIMGRPGIQLGDVQALMFLLEDPAGQKFVLKVESSPDIKVVGGLMKLVGNFNIACFEIEANDILWEGSGG